MQLKNYSFEHLPFTKLFQTYIHDFDKLSNFFETDPFNPDSVKNYSDNLKFKGSRESSAEILERYNRQFDLDDAAFKNIERLKNKDSLTVVTGQQLGLYGGPLYTIFKTLTVIQLARYFEDWLDRPVIPVFWLADEDHDYDEVRSISMLNGDDVEKVALPAKNGSVPRVADMNLPSGLTEVREQVRKLLGQTDFSDSLWDLLDACYKEETTFNRAFGNLIGKMFSKHGLVLAGSNDDSVKKHSRDIIKKAISDADELRHELDNQTAKISENYHQQVTLYDSNLFYLDGDNRRVKINRNGDGWSTETGNEWSTDRLLDDIDTSPEKFSPNVFLRPILQDYFLPTLGYVAGPGETAYYGQMKSFYACFGQRMPVIFPRLSATLIEPSIDRIIDELPFEFYEYFMRIEDLESAYVDRTEQIDIEAIFSEWKENIEDISNRKTERIVDIDPTLEGAAGKATAVYFGELDKLKGKVYRAVKQQDQTQLNRIRKIKSNLFPGDGMQERIIAAIYFMNKYGVDIWDRLLETVGTEAPSRHHKLIYL